MLNKKLKYKKTLLTVKKSRREKIKIQFKLNHFSNMCSKYARCISQVSEKHNASSIYSHFTDLHEILYTFQQHSIHLNTLTNFRFICLGSP